MIFQEDWFVAIEKPTPEGWQLKFRLMIANGASRPQIRLFSTAAWARVAANRLKLEVGERAMAYPGAIVSIDEEGEPLEEGFVLYNRLRKTSKKDSLGGGNHHYTKLYVRKYPVLAPYSWYQAKFIQTSRLGQVL